MIHEFRLTSRGNGGVLCDEGGVFVGAVPMLARTRSNGRDEWRPRDCDELSKDMSAQYGLPIDMSSKRGGLTAIAKALNEGDVVRAQVATVLLGIPHPPSLSKGAPSRQEMIKLARDLQWSGLLKADWDSDEHPRWPAGAPDSQGGQFAPKGDEPAAGQSAGGAAESRQPPAQARDPGVSTSRPRYDFGAPSDNHSAPEGENEGGDNRRDVSGAEDPGIYASYGRYIGGARLAAASVPMDGVAAANPANWANVTRPADGALKLGSGQIIAAATLLAATDALRERAAVNAAMSKLDLDPTSAADVLAARAYVWAQDNAPLNYFDVPWSGPQLESVSQSIMLVELARPGTLYLALQGDRLSTTYLDMAAQDGLSDAAVLESRIRPANAPAALQTTTTSARAALKLQPNDNKRAHRLVSVNIITENLPLAMLASTAGWRTDSPENLIALPGDLKTQANMVLDGSLLPIHNSAHPDYDAQTRLQIRAALRELDGRLTPLLARAMLENVALTNRAQIISGVWLPRLH
ncbi:MAG: hypothetical protein ABSG83_13365 [Roseiarcus sp.]